MKRRTVFHCVGYLVYNSTTRFWSCPNLRIIIRFQAITCGAENTRSQLWVNSLFYGTTIVVYGHERHHQCAAYRQQLMLFKSEFGLGGLRVQYPSPFNLSSDIPREKVTDHCKVNGKQRHDRSDGVSFITPWWGRISCAWAWYCFGDSKIPRTLQMLRPVQRLGEGRGCNNFVPVLGGNGTKRAPTRDIFDQPPGQMR